MKFMLFLFNLPLIFTLKGFLLLDTRYSTIIGNTTYSAFDIHTNVVDSIEHVNNFQIETTETLNAVTLYLNTATIMNVYGNSTDYVISNDSTTLIFYSTVGISNAFLGSILLSYSNDTWLTNLQRYSLLERLNSTNQTESVDWNTSASVVIRSNVFPDNKCHLHIHSYDSISTISLYHDNINQNIETSSWRSDVTLFPTYTTSEHDDNIVFYTTNIYDTKTINSIDISFDSNITMNAKSFATFTDCSYIDQLTRSNTCINDDSSVSSNNETCSMIQSANLLNFYCGFSNASYENFNPDIDCCACGGGFNKYNTLVQTQNPNIKNTNIIHLQNTSNVLSENDVVNGTNYVIQMLVNFEMTCTDFQTNFGSIFNAQLGQYLYQLLTKSIYEHELSCYYKLTLETDDKMFAIALSNYFNRLIPITHLQTILYIDLQTIPSYTYVVSASNLTAAYNSRNNTGYCTYSINTDAILA